MATKRESILTKEYPANDSKFPARAARGVEPLLPPFKPIAGKLGPYELVCELGSGGMGTVYVARRTYEGGVTRTVALKTLRKDLAGQADLVEMFMDEARITSRISHPYVCTVMDIGSAEGVPFVTMDYLIGEPLSRLAPLMAAEQTEASVACILRVIANLCEGLHAAHEQRDESGNAMQVVHRDISPDNLFVLYDGSVRVADFGIACTAEHQKSGKANALAGKSGYMSPEQIRGQILDRRADVWSMGVVLWELLTGKRLFRPGTEIAATVAVLERPIDSPSKFNKLVPSGLDAVVRKALHRDRDHRYPNARAMALELENVLTRCFGPVSAARVSGWLDDLFPGCQEFRRTIVVRAQEWVRAQQKLEFDPELASLTPGMLLLPQTASREIELLAMAQTDVSGISNSFSVFNGASGELPLPDDISSIIPVVTGAPKRTDSLESLDVELSDEANALAAAQLPQVAIASVPWRKKRVLQTAAIAFAGGLVLTGAVALLSRGRAPEAVAIKAKPAVTAPAASVPVVVAPTASAPTHVEAAPVAPVPAPVVEAQPVVETAPVVEAKPLETKPVIETATAEPKAKRAKVAEASETDQTMGQVYVYAKDGGDYYVLVQGKEVHTPALLRLSVDVGLLTVREGKDGAPRQLRVHISPESPSMVKVD